MSKGDARGKDKLIEEAGVPVAKEFGEHSGGTGKELAEAGHTLARGLNALVGLLKPVVWGLEEIQDRWFPVLEAKLRRVPEERQILPDLWVAGPTLEALKFAGEKQELRELFANLLVTAMDSDTAKFAHPAYVEIIKQLSPDEAKIVAYIGEAPEERSDFALIDIRHDNKKEDTFQVKERNLTLLGQFAGCEHAELVPSYVDNLCRLEILARIPDGQGLQEDRYEPLVATPAVQALLEKYGKDAYVHKRAIWLTEFGKQFVIACASPS